MNSTLSRVGVRDHDILFYDGECGLCHGAVQFVVARDNAGHFRFAPLQGDTIAAAIDEAERAGLPDSIVVLTVAGTILVKSRAAAYIGAHLGAAWPMLAAVVRIIPRLLGDFCYDAIARVRRRLFAKPKSACPLLPAELRDRFLP